MHRGFPTGQLFLIAGPCVVENDDLHAQVVEALRGIEHFFPGGVAFKASFDKANRSNAGAPRGPGVLEGLAMLDRVRSMSGLPVITDVHLPDQCASAAQAVDLLQIPAFLCRQTDLLLAAGATQKPVNVKKGQWMQPDAMRGALEKVRSAQTSTPDATHASVATTERGTFFGYGDLVVDMRSFAQLRTSTGAPVIFDGTHSVQQPGRGRDGTSGGLREHIPDLVLAAVAAGADGLFLEVHPDPEHAPSDGANMLPLNALAPLMRRVTAVWEARRS